MNGECNQYGQTRLNDYGYNEFIVIINKNLRIFWSQMPTLQHNLHDATAIMNKSSDCPAEFVITEFDCNYKSRDSTYSRSPRFYNNEFFPFFFLQ